MSWSLGEAAALAVKAARGAGLPWGLAEEAGLALRRLEAQGLPGAAALALYLYTLEAGADPTPAFMARELAREQAGDGAGDLAGDAAGDAAGEVAGPLCPIRLGAALADAAHAPAEIPSLRQPLLLVPFLAAFTEGVLEWDGARVAIDRQGVTAAGDALLAVRADCRFDRAAAPRPVGARRVATRVPASAAPYMAILSDLAARTYAPATEASRLAGAGAGVNDND